MALRTITQKVVQVEKRSLEEQKPNGFSTFAVFAFWILAVTASVLLASVTYFTVDHEERRASIRPEIDVTTTAGISALPPQNGNNGQLKARSISNGRRLDDVTRVIGRIRGEQTNLNDRLAELDNTIRQMTQRTVKLERELAAYRAADKQPKKPIVVPEELKKVKAERSPKSDRPVPQATKQEIPKKISPKPVETKRVVKKKTAPKKSAIRQIYSNDVQPIAKNVSPQSEIDQTTVSSINIAERSKFAIDLGVNPTKGRAAVLWNSLAASRPDVLNNLTPRYLPTGQEEGETRLVAGPYEDAGEAIRACVELRTTDTFCKTTLFPQ